MDLLRQFVARCIGLLRRRRLEAEMAEEMRQHLEQRVREKIAGGLTTDEASHAAQREFGGVAQVQERCRDERGFMWFEQLRQDLRYGFRQLRRKPAFAAIVVLTLALGIGANAAIFSAVHAVLIKSLPYARAEQIYSVEAVIPGRLEQLGTLPVRIQDYREWSAAPTVFSDVAAVRPSDWVITGSGEPERVGGARVSTNFFSFLGVPLAHGRGFTADEATAGKDRVVVISDGLWRRRFGADPAIVGQSIQLGGTPHTIVGIAPASLLMPTGALLHPSLTFAPRIDLWKPIAPTAAELRGESWNHGLLVRLPPTANAEHGRQQLQAMLNRSIRATVPDLKVQLGIRLVPLREVFSGKVRQRLLFVQGASLLLLAVACINVANLLLARLASQATEFATRIALGAGRSRILRQVLTETLLLAALAGIAGAVLGWVGARWLTLQGPDELRLLGGTRMDWAVVWFSLGVAAVTGLLCGVFPAWQAFHREAAVTLQDGARQNSGGARAGRVRQFLIGLEVALSTALLACAGLLLHSFVNVARAPRGYQIERELAIDLTLSGSRYAPADSRVAFFAGLAEAARALPGVEAAGLISDLPASGATATTQAVFLESDADPQVGLQRPLAAIRAVTPGYFAASGSTLRAGRWLEEREPVPAALLGESLAHRLWPGEPLPAIVGRAIREGNVVGPLITIVGVVEDARSGGAERELPPQLYRPHAQRADGRMTLLLRTAQEPGSLAAALRSAIRSRDANLPIPAIATMREIVSAAIAARRFETQLTLLFAVVALVLGAVGVYGVISYAVTCRMRDFGVRIALGATKADVMRWVFALGLRPALGGLAIGLGAAVALATGLRAALFEIAPTDPVSLGAVALTLLTASTVACWLPARRAAKVDPMVALRGQ